MAASNDTKKPTTNNKKKKVGFTKEALQRGNSSKKLKSKPAPPTLANPGLASSQQQNGLSRGQLTSLIMLALGISRILKLGSAVGNPTDVVCYQHLGTDACQHDVVHALLRYKYYSAIQCTMIAIAMILQCWYTENLLQTLDATFIISPIATLVSALAVSDGVLDGKIQNIMMSVVLTALAIPSCWDTIPFMRKRPYGRYKNFQTLSLLTLAMFSFYEGIGQTLLPMLFPQYFVGGNQEQPVPLDRMLILQQQQQQSSIENNVTESISITEEIDPAVNAILYLVVVDKITHALLYFFAWYYFPTDRQRTVLLTIALMKLGEYYYHLPRLAQEYNIDGYDLITLTMSCGCGLGWIMPDISWKKSLGSSSGGGGAKPKAS